MTRVLVSKIGLDGHDRGLRLLARVLRDSGCEVIMLGIGATPSTVARAAVDEDVDVLGISILSGAHLELVPRLLGELQALGAEDLPVVVGGTIPSAHAQRLRDAGVQAVVPTGTPMDEAVRVVTHAALPT